MGLALQNSVEEQPENAGHHQSSADINYGMLLQEHGGKYDQDRQYQGAPADKMLVPEVITVPDCDAGCHGIKNMDTRKYIGRGIGCIQAFDDIGQKVVPRKAFRTKLQSVWPYPGYKEEDGHSCTQIKAVAVEFPCAGWSESKPDEKNRDIYKPEIIGDDKPFTEGNHLVNRR